MSAIFYWYALVRSKREVGEKLHFAQGYRNKPSEPIQNRFKIRMVRKSEPEIEPVRKRYIPFSYEQKGRSSSGPRSGPAGFLQVHASAFHLLSPSILEELSFRACVFFNF